MNPGCEAAARAIDAADAILIGAGAGMGVDSGLPDFRGNEGFWRAYPAFAKLGLSFVDLANPRWFERDPELAWGFYGHRLNLYRETIPHAGFEILKRWGDARPHGAFAFTSNVDGQFQRAEFAADRICECHGSIHHLQCTEGCTDRIWSADAEEVSVGTDLRAEPPLPACPDCQALARPNILMFGDGGWNAERTDAQEHELQRWLGSVRRLVVIECGAGTAVPTVRWTCERTAAAFGGSLVRINPREAQGPKGTISIAAGSLEALAAIDALLS